MVQAVRQSTNIDREFSPPWSSRRVFDLEIRFLHFRITLYLSLSSMMEIQITSFFREVSRDQQKAAEWAS